MGGRGQWESAVGTVDARTARTASDGLRGGLAERQAECRGASAVARGSRVRAGGDGGEGAVAAGAGVGAGARRAAAGAGEGGHGDAQCWRGARHGPGNDGRVQRDAAMCAAG